ncbi:hypothetical protein [Poseidonocella sp. HB161398]|uniref:hypothetical protein n=1 Tax=Poseidonocella sp. HB161398 TaxID=2320855 RepID=UPI001108FC78|nr:hypothetical protein [Poseidonocella sp. HB161398]
MKSCRPERTLGEDLADMTLELRNFAFALSQAGGNVLAHDRVSMTDAVLGLISRTDDLISRAGSELGAGTGTPPQARQGAQSGGIRPSPRR